MRMSPEVPPILSEFTYGDHVSVRTGPSYRWGRIIDFNERDLMAFISYDDGGVPGWRDLKFLGYSVPTTKMNP